MLSDLCVRCAHYTAAGACVAYRDGIPEEILLGDVDHHEPYDGDGGIVFVPDAPDLDDTDEEVAARATPIRAASALPARPMRRQLYPQEIAAAVDFNALDLAYTSAVDDVHALLDHVWIPGLVAQARDAIHYTKAGTDRKRLSSADAARIRLLPPVVEELVAVLLDAARNGAANAAAELLDQGRSIIVPDDDALHRLVTDQAQAVAQQTADGVTLAASRRAVQLAGSGRTVPQIGDDVAGYVAGLKHTWERDQLAGAVQAATNAARLATFAKIPEREPVAFYSSELLDAATCSECAAIDGREFDSLTEAHLFYPTGGYVDCQGGPRCRGTVIAVMQESEVAPGTPSHLGPALV